VTSEKARQDLSNVMVENVEVAQRNVPVLLARLSQVGNYGGAGRGDLQQAASQPATILLGKSRDVGQVSQCGEEAGYFQFVGGHGVSSDIACFARAIVNRVIFRLH
jgi:hypothetical protein